MVTVSGYAERTRKDGSFKSVDISFELRPAKGTLLN